MEVENDWIMTRFIPDQNFHWLLMLRDMSHIWPHPNLTKSTKQLIIHGQNRQCCVQWSVIFSSISCLIEERWAIRWWCSWRLSVTAGTVDGMKLNDQDCVRTARYPLGTITAHVHSVLVVEASQPIGMISIVRRTMRNLPWHHVPHWIEWKSVRSGLPYFIV